ncbi:hypothetical protein RhiTH_007640 [Rhizoctonia solani]
MNEKGELPWMHRLPEIRVYNEELLDSHSVESLVGYLKFYDIGAELIDEETGELKPGRKEDAEKLLSHRLARGYPSIS